MFNNKYGKVLTVLLIIIIIAIIGLIIFLVYEQIEKNKAEKDAMAAIEEFDRTHGISTETTPTPEEIPSLEEPSEVPEIIPPTSVNSSPGNSVSSNSDGRTYYKGFVMVGYIEIPRTNAYYPILEKVTIKSLESAVVLLYPENAKLNEPGNVVIAGHNYRNSTFFSKNKTLKEGDKIYIADESGRKLTYTVYSNFQASDIDTSFYVRDTDGVPEITLTTCVANDSSKRTIILARAD